MSPIRIRQSLFAMCVGIAAASAQAAGPDTVDLRADQVVSQMPIELWTESGLPMTYNPVWIETTATGLRAYFMPEDGKSTLYIYEADVK